MQAGDWPTVHPEAQRTGRTRDCLRGSYRVEWVRSFPGEAIGTRVEAIVAQGKVYVGTLQGTRGALDRRTGEVVWKHRCDGSLQHSPAYADGQVYVGDTGGALWAIEAARGRPLWRFRSGQGGFVASPLVAGGTVFLGSRDGTVYAVDAAHGNCAGSLLPEDRSALPRRGLAPGCSAPPMTCTLMPCRPITVSFFGSPSDFTARASATPIR